MDRKWRLNRGALNTVLSFPAFCKLVDPWKESYKLATLTDLYAVYTVLHIESKDWEVRWSPEGEFYYFIAKQTMTQTQQAAVPEGDEDMPAPITETEMAERDQIDNEASKAANLLDKIEAAEFSGEEEEQDYQAEEEDVDDGEALEEEEEEDGLDKEIPKEPASQPEIKNVEPTIRTQLLVPVSSACTELTPELLQRFFLVRGVQVQQMILGLVDSNGVVTRCCLYNYTQAPLEGPGTANLELLDD